MIRLVSRVSNCPEGSVYLQSDPVIGGVDTASLIPPNLNMENVSTQCLPTSQVSSTQQKSLDLLYIKCIQCMSWKYHPQDAILTTRPFSYYMFGPGFYKPSFATVTNWGGDPIHTLPN